MIIINWNEFKKQCSDLAKSIVKAGKAYSGIYGVPRGGVFVAMELSLLLKLPLKDEPDFGTLLVDDIVDSGRTLAEYMKGYPELDFASLHFKKHSKIIPTYYGQEIDDWIQYPWEKEVGGIESNIVRLLEYIGENPNREGLKETPDRVARAYKEWFGGYKKNPDDIMKVFTSENDDQIVVVKNIDFYSHCEHHMAPFYGQVHIGYLPNGKVLGVSKFARLVEIFARRLQIQERMTDQIARSIDTYLKPQGVGVVIEGIHLCMRSRGVEKQNSIMTTSAMLGAFREREGVRQEFLKLINL